MNNNTELWMILILSLIIGFGIGYVVHTPKVETKYITKTDTLKVPADTVKGVGKVVVKYKPVYVLIPFNPDSLAMDSLKSIARDYLRIRPDYQTHRSDSVVDVTITAFPLTRDTKDSIIIKQKNIPHPDTTQVNTTIVNGTPWWYYPTGIAAIVISFLFGHWF
jgi:hypothetical protein